MVDDTQDAEHEGYPLPNEGANPTPEQLTQPRWIEEARETLVKIYDDLNQGRITGLSIVVHKDSLPPQHVVACGSHMLPAIIGGHAIAMAELTSVMRDTMQQMGLLPPVVHINQTAPQFDPNTGERV